MNRLPFSTQFLAGVLAVAGVASVCAAATSETIQGRVRDVRDGSIEVCFYHGYTPGDGEQFALLRNVVVAVPKTQSPIRRENVGAIRLNAAVQNGCAAATLLRGEVRNSDWIVALRDDTR